jgi:AcrR family transcriptional regulator
MRERKNEILKAALELYNKKGLDNVTTRDIAKKINISSGNLTYHFPTRNDIVKALMDRLLIEIDKALSVSFNSPSISSIVVAHHQCKIIIKKQLQYEFLFNKRYGELITTLPELQVLLQQVLVKRFDQWLALNEQMVNEGLAIAELIKDTDAHSHVLNIVGLYWHQEAAIYHPKMNQSEKVDYGLALIFQLYKPYLTKKGQSELEPLIKNLSHY